MNDALQALEVKVENGGATPQGKVFAKEWNVLVEAVKALDLKEFDEAALHKFLQDNGYITEDNIPTTDLSDFVTLATEQAISGRKNFVGGVEVNGQELVYDAEKKVWQLTGDLVVTGAVTMFGSLSGFTPSTVMDAVQVDGTTIVKTKNSQGQWQLTAIGGGGSGGTGGGLTAAEVNTLINAALVPYALKESIPTNNTQLENGAGYITDSALNGYATEQWVSNQGFAKQSALTAVDNRLAAVEVFFATEDSDTLINKWSEIVDFLNATEGDTLDNILKTKANQSALDAAVTSLTTEIGKKWTQDNTKITNWDSAYSWGNHANAGYAAKTYVDGELAKYVKLAVAQSIEAQHNFVNGFRIGGLGITKSQDDVIYVDANLVVRGAVTMFGSGATIAPSIWASIPFDDTMEWNGSEWRVVGGGSGSVNEATVNNLIYEYLTQNNYAKISDISSALTGYATQTWVEGKKYLTGITSSMVTTALGYTPYNSANFTKANIKTTLGISDWALAATKPSYTAAEVGALSTSGGSLSGAIMIGAFTSFGVAGGNFYLGSPEYPLLVRHSGTATINGNAILHSENISSYNAGSATKLQTARTIWGQSFDGTGNVYGNLTIGYYAIYLVDGNENYKIGWNSKTELEFTSYYGHVFNAGHTEALRIDVNANIAIGGTTADAKLHVHGDAKVTGHLGLATGFDLGGVNAFLLSGNNVYIGSKWYNTILRGSILDFVVGDTTAMQISADGNTTINGNIEGGVFGLRNSNPDNPLLRLTVGNQNYYVQATSEGIYLGSASTLSLKVEANGNTTINGNLLATGAITMFSQLSMKNVIDYDGLALAQLAQIKPARFTWKDGRDNRTHVGGIADEVMQILPEVIHRTSDDKLTMDYGSAAFYIGTSLIKPVIELWEVKDKQQQEIESLKKRVKHLENENRQLRAS